MLNNKKRQTKALRWYKVSDELGEDWPVILNDHEFTIEMNPRAARKVIAFSGFPAARITQGEFSLFLGAEWINRETVKMYTLTAPGLHIRISYGTDSEPLVDEIGEVLLSHGAWLAKKLEFDR